MPQASQMSKAISVRSTVRAPQPARQHLLGSRPRQVAKRTPGLLKAGEADAAGAAEAGAGGVDAAGAEAEVGGVDAAWAEAEVGEADAAWAEGIEKPDQCSLQYM